MSSFNSLHDVPCHMDHASIPALDAEDFMSWKIHLCLNIINEAIDNQNT